MAKEKKARHKFQMSSAKDNMLPRPGSAHTRIVAVSGNLRRVRETPRVMRVAGEAVVEATTSDYGCFGGMLDGVSPADLDETASQYIDPELVRRKRYTASISHHEFYLSLERLTDNLGIDAPNTRYKAFMCMVRQFRAERMFKRAGRGCIEDGIERTETGQLSLACPACPQPGVNIPEGWETADEQDKYLYSLLVSMDANFRLKNRMRSSEEADPGLVTGLAYFVEPRGYSQHLKRFATQTDLVSLGHTLRRKILLALAESSRQQRIFEDITLTIQGRNDAIIPMWTTMIKLWEADKAQPNPYEFTKTHSAKSQKEVQLELVEDERKTLAAGSPLLHKTTPTSFLVACLGLEDKQRKIRMACKQADMTPQQATDIEQGRLIIQSTLNRIRSAQRAYMPILESLMAEDADETSSRDIEDVPLWLPSAVDASQRESGCTHGLAAKEEMLREAQCHDALDKIRALQRGKAHLVIYKNRNVRGQRPSTRARTSLDRLDDRIRMETVRYRDARTALLSLRGHGPWEVVLQPLQDADLRPPSAFDIDDPDDAIGADGKKKSQKKLQALRHLGDGHKKASWVWTTTGTLPEEDNGDFEISEGELLCGVPWEGLEPDMAEGVHAYALRQAKVYERLLQDFSELWLTPFTSKPKKRLPLPSSPEAADACDDESDDDLPPDTSGDPSIPNPDARKSPSPPAAVNTAANFPKILVTNTPLTIPEIPVTNTPLAIPEIPVTNTPLNIPEMTIEVGMAID
ncbi:hypothetical protein EYR38_003160 [Pleurotus pulmonarius]|nr:hypothetical protein EYR38_003160 [Pleurotus pulmonarius]